MRRGERPRAGQNLRRITSGMQHLSKNHQLRKVSGIRLRKRNRLKIMLGIQFHKKNQLKIMHGIQFHRRNQLKTMHGIQFRKKSHRRIIIHGNQFHWRNRLKIMHGIQFNKKSQLRVVVGMQPLKKNPLKVMSGTLLSKNLHLETNGMLWYKVNRQRGTGTTNKNQKVLKTRGELLIMLSQSKPGDLILKLLLKKQKKLLRF